MSSLCIKGNSNNQMSVFQGKTVRKEDLKIIFFEGKVSSVFFRSLDGKEVEIRSYNLSREFKKVNNPSCLEDSFFTASRLSDGCYKVSLSFRGRGGMLVRTLRRDLQTMEETKDSYAPLINALDRSLMDVKISSYTKTEGIILETAATSVGIASGAAFGGCVFGLPGAVVGGILCGAAGLIFSQDYVNEYREESLRIKKEVEEIFRKHLEIVRAFAKGDEGERDKLCQDFIQYLKKCGYLGDYSNRKLVLGDRFSQVSKFYSKEKLPLAIASIKFLVLSSIASLPTKNVPVESLLDNFEQTAKEAGNCSSEIKDGCFIMLARSFLVFKQDHLTSIEHAKKVGKESGLYKVAMALIEAAKDSNLVE